MNAHSAMTLGPPASPSPLLGYFALAFAISWGGILMILAVRGFDLSAMRSGEAGLVLVAMLLGPSVSRLILTALVDGRAGMSQLWARLMRWQVSTQWYAVALLTMLAILLTILWLLRAAIDPVFSPRFQWPLFAVGLIAGTFEEIGWTGFATPRLLARYSLPVAGLSLGFTWALWHLLVDFRYNVSAMGIAWPLEFAIVHLATLTPYRILMTWVYSHTRSLFLAILMHASFTGELMRYLAELAWSVGTQIVNADCHNQKIRGVRIQWSGQCFTVWSVAQPACTR
jgi:uncharacterized protein